MTDQALAELAAIPDLALEVETTRYAPNPTDRPARSNSTPGSRPPLSIAMLHALMPAGDEPGQQAGLRGTLAMDVRLIIEELAELEWTFALPPWPSDTWAGICDWLTRTHPWWSTTDWADDIARDIHRVHAELRDLARVPRPARYRCPGEPVPGPLPVEQYRCSLGHTHPADVARTWPRRPLTPAVDVAAELGIRVDRIRQWRHRGKLRHWEHRDGRIWVQPWEVLLLARPDIAAALRAQTPPGAAGSR